MTISQGMRVPGGGFAAHLPEGFAFPIASNEPLYVMTQVLNHNIEHPKHLNVRHRVHSNMSAIATSPSVRFLFSICRSPNGADVGQSARDHIRDLARSGRALRSELSGWATRAERRWNGIGLRRSERPPHDGHWVVPPGKQVNTSDASWFMNLPYDSKTALRGGCISIHSRNR